MCDFFSGHGIGEYLHMSPCILHMANNDMTRMKPGMIFTIEPVITIKKVN